MRVFLLISGISELVLNIFFNMHKQVRHSGGGCYGTVVTLVTTGLGVIGFVGKVEIPVVIQI